jgi:sulfite exporter TauE/SafE/copper chaperone CopZ/plastocyanin domain-containing protein
METETLKIGGMSCVNCQNRIEKALCTTAGVAAAAVDFNTGTATVTYDAETLTRQHITAIIERLGYKVLDGASPAPLSQAGGYIVMIIALWMLLQQFGAGALSGAFPLAEAGMGYGMLFIIGLITSVHCVAMCGGINLSQTMGRREGKMGYGVWGIGNGESTEPNYQTTELFHDSTINSQTTRPIPHTPYPVLLPAILYNSGRVISYTVIGGIVGALGSVLTISGQFRGIVQILAGVFMVIMGVNMLGLFPALRKFTVRMPKIFAKKIEAEKEVAARPLVIGLLNGLMPCGPLQAMQLYALSTGSPVAGAVSMFLFSLGTVPLMFALGALSTALSGVKGRAFSARVMKAGAVLVAVLGLSMFSQGWNLGGLPSPLDTVSALFERAAPSNISAARGQRAIDGAPAIVDGVQYVNSTLSGGRYPAITVQAGIPVKWTITAPQGSVNGCNNRMLIREYGIEYGFKTGENIIEFTPERTGRIPYSCWMGMIRSSITVVAEGEAALAGANDDVATVTPAGVVIPAEDIAFAEYNEEGYQTVAIDLRDDGFSPSLIVLEKNIPTIWIINNDSLEAGNNELVFPAFYTKIPMRSGDNPIQLMPTGDFDFSTADNVYYGFVKVVDDLGAADIEAIKAEVSDWETQIYPDEYFEDGVQAAGCCG